MNVWKVTMAVSPNRRSIVNTYHVTAKTLKQALARAEKLEKEWTDEMTQPEGEQFIPAEPVGVEWFCELDSSMDAEE